MHFHADHICGLPFFKPLFNSEMTVRLHSFGPEAANLRDALGIYLQDPIFPMGLADFEADLQFKHHDPNETLSFNELNVTALPIPHPGGAHALKASNGPKNFVYATDTEHSPSDPNQSLVAVMRTQTWPFMTALMMMMNLLRDAVGVIRHGKRDCALLMPPKSKSSAFSITIRNAPMRCF